ncbi:MAG: cytochrome P450 [Porticoccaceae bacterium]|jgi:cytochrome P450|nr:cytochrome P450 [Porticoccaceae bacterium]MDG1448013.1 cytochrome P450 [Porticoccaceae bacterium]
MSTETLPEHVPEHLVRDFNMYAPPGIEKDFHEAWARLLQEDDSCPLVWTQQNEGHWLPTRSSIIEEILTDYSRFSSRSIILPKSHSADHGLLPTTIDPPEHHFYRKTLNHSMAPAAINAMGEDIRAIVTSLIDGFADRGECNFTQDFADILPIRVFLSMMDLPEKDIPQTKYWTDQLIRPDGTITFAEALQNLKDYIAPYVDQRMGADGTDMLSRMINTETNGRRLTREEAIKLSIQVFIAGVDTVVNLLGFVFLFLARNKPHRQQIITGQISVSDAVEEILRRFPLVTVAREVTEDMEFHGVQLKAGDMVAAPTPLAGMDNTFTPNAVAVEFGRKQGNSLTFGRGAHTCPGKNLARVELRIAIEEWLRRIPDFDVNEDAEVSFSSGIVGVVNQLNLRW